MNLLDNAGAASTVPAVRNIGESDPDVKRRKNSHPGRYKVRTMKADAVEYLDTEWLVG